MILFIPKLLICTIFWRFLRLQDARIYIYSLGPYKNMRRGVVMAAIILLSTMVVVPPASAGGLGSEDPGVTDTVTWRVGDKWVYAGSFDPTLLVQGAGVDAVVGTINGDAVTTVDAVNEVELDGVQTPRS